MQEQSSRSRSGTPDSIRESLKKATTEMMVLFVLRKKPMYTYEMMHEIETLSKGKISFNTLYQTIYRLQSYGYITELEKVLSEDNRVRIYFGVTPEGGKYLPELIVEYRTFTDAVDGIIGLDRRAQVEEEGA